MEARRLARYGLRTAVALTAACTLVATGLAWNLQHRLTTGTVTSDALVASTPTPVDGEFTALLIGLDARTDASGNPLPQPLLDALHAGPDEGQLHTDTIMLLHVPAGQDATAVAISIPRDSFVPIAGGHGTHKINSAYRRGMRDAEEQLAAQGVTGAQLDMQAREAGRATLVATVQDLTGVTVDHLAEINLAGFVELTEAVGGVPVCLNEPVRDPYSGVDLQAGPQTVSGAGALAFVRQRHGLAGGDLDRIARQQAFAEGLAHRLTDTGTLTDPDRLGRLVDIAARHVVLDRGWNIDQLAGQLRRLGGGRLDFGTVPTGRPDLNTPVDGVAVQIDPEQVRDYVRAATTVPGADPETTRIDGARVGPYRSTDPDEPALPDSTPAGSGEAAGTGRGAGSPDGNMSGAPAATGGPAAGTSCVD